MMREFAGLYERLDKQCGYYSRHFGHLRALIGNDDWVRVVDESISGRVLLMGNSEIINSLILFNTRMFDTGLDTITIHKLVKKLPTEEEIKRYHLERMMEIGIEYSLDEHFCARKQFIASSRGLRKSSTASKLRLLRDYTLAHNIDPENEPDRATLSDLLKLTESVTNLVDLAGYIVRNSRGVYRSFAEQAEKETRMLYAALPQLAAVEKE